MKNTNDLEKMNETIASIKEYQQLQKELDEQLEALKFELKTLLKDNDMDEVVTDSGKATWRDVQSSRFASTEFKKVHADLYKAFTTTTTYKRLTVN